MPVNSLEAAKEAVSASEKNERSNLTGPLGWDMASLSGAGCNMPAISALDPQISTLPHT